MTKLLTLLLIPFLILSVSSHAAGAVHSHSSLCAIADQECGLPEEGQKECCSGYQCTWTDNIPGAPGTCKPVLGDSDSLCASANEDCGLEFEGQRECCSGYQCVWTHNLPGAPGKCQKQDLCASQGQKCGSPWEGQQECCAGYSCIAESNALGAPGVCQATIGAGFCASNGQACGLEEEGQKSCCIGYNCQWDENSADGAPGKCVPQQPLVDFSVLASNTINFNYCAVENQSCGLEEEGQAKCCDGYQCAFNGGMRGAPGICQKEGVLCASYGESCGIPEEGGNNCCRGYKCTWEANAPIGAKGKCAAIP